MTFFRENFSEAGWKNTETELFPIFLPIFYDDVDQIILMHDVFYFLMHEKIILFYIRLAAPISPA